MPAQFFMQECEIILFLGAKLRRTFVVTNLRSMLQGQRLSSQDFLARLEIGKRQIFVFFLWTNGALVRLKSSFLAKSMSSELTCVRSAARI